jgi:hypothetical protein
MTHADLVLRAAKWLKQDHCVVVTELTDFESADAIGFKSNGISTLIECKTSMADFRADANKSFRTDSESGMGYIRYYLTPKGLLNPFLLPNQWGLLEADARGCKVIKKPTFFNKYNRKRELAQILSILRRIGHNAPPGVNIKTYTHHEGTKTKATVSTEIDEDYCI